MTTNHLLPYHPRVPYHPMGGGHDNRSRQGSQDAKIAHNSAVLLALLRSVISRHCYLPTTIPAHVAALTLTSYSLLINIILITCVSVCVCVQYISGTYIFIICCIIRTPHSVTARLAQLISIIMC